MDLCCICMVNERNKDFRGLCSFKCLINYATELDGECLIQKFTIFYKDKKFQKNQARGYVWEELVGKIPLRSKIYSSCGEKYCLNINHMKMMAVSAHTKQRRHYYASKRAKEEERIKTFRITFCRLCRKEISMIDRLNPYCDYSCETRHIIRSEIDMLRYDFIGIVEIDEMKIFVKEKCEAIIKLVSE